MRREFTVEDMLHFAVEAWGQRGDRIVVRWQDYNARYFAGVLRPVPIVITHAQPFGRRLAFCSYDAHFSTGRTITLNMPSRHKTLVADSNTLIHEMVHQYLFERDEDPSHAGAPWRREIMRLQVDLGGAPIWAGRSKTARDKTLKGKVVRINEPALDGTPSLAQAQIARWPHDGCGIDLGRL